MQNLLHEGEVHPQFPDCLKSRSIITLILVHIQAF